MMKFFKALLVCLIVTSFISVPNPVAAETIYQPEHVAKFRIEKNEGIINIQGTIDEDSATQTDNAFIFFKLHNIHNVIIHLHSLGGSVKAGIKIIDDMNAAKDLKVDVITMVDHKEYCASMCTAIFAAGSSRIAAADTIWMFHSPFVKLTDEEKNDPMIVLAAKLQTATARRIMLAVYRSADPMFTDTVLVKYVNDDTGKQLILYGSDLIKHTNFITFGIIN